METKEATVGEVKALLESHRGIGHVDHRLYQEVEKPGKIFVGTLESPEEFFSLVWQSIPEVRPLVPVGRPRTLYDCAFRLSKFEWQFQRLVQQGYGWFEGCVDIDLDFDCRKLGLIALTPLLQEERQETPAGSYYIYDGVHRSIVFAKRLMRREVEFSPQKLLLLTPRRS